MFGSFDGGGVVFQRATRIAVLGTAIVIAPSAVLQVVLAQMVYGRLDDLGGVDDAVVSVPELVGGIDAATGVESVVAFTSILVASVVVALAGGFAASLNLRHAAGRPLGIGATWRATIPRVPALLGAWAIGHSWLVVGSLIAVQVPAEVVAPFAVIALPMLLVLTSATALVSPVVVVERLGAVAAVRRSVRLFRMRWTTVAGFVVLCTLVGGGIRLAIQFLPTLLAQTGLITFGGARGVVDGVAAQLGVLVAVPLVALATARFHLQMRMDAEGLDLVTERLRVFGGATT